MSGDEKMKHEDVWEAIDGLRETHVETQKELSGVISLLKSLSQEVKNLADIIHRPQDKFNWIGFGALVVGVLMCAGAYTSSVISPIRERGRTNSDVIMARMNESIVKAEKDGEQSARIDMLATLMADMKGRMHDVEQQGSHAEADVDNIKSWLTQVDMRGSRVHVMSTPDLIGAK